MVKPADSRQSDDSGIERGAVLRRSARWRIPQLCVDPIVVVVVDVLSQETSQVSLVEHDLVIQQFTSNRPDPALRGPVLPRTSVRGRLRLQSQMPDGFDEASGENAVVVADQEAE